MVAPGAEVRDTVQANCRAGFRISESTWDPPRDFADRLAMVCFFRKPSFYQSVCRPIAAFAGS